MRFEMMLIMTAIYDRWRNDEVFYERCKISDQLLHITSTIEVLSLW